MTLLVAQSAGQFSRFLSMQAQAAFAPAPLGVSIYRDPLATETLAKFRRLTAYYQIPIASALQQNLIGALDRLRSVVARKDAHFEKGRSGAKARLSAARAVYPEGPRWLQDLLIHLYLERKTPADDFGFVLRAARLMQGVSNEDVGRNGFNDHRMKYVEKGSLLKRGSFREAVAIYGVPYRALAYSYLRKHAPKIEWERLAFYPGPVFIDAAERPKIAGYVRRPGTLGERVFFARAKKDMTQQELVEAVQAEIGRLAPSGRLRCVPPKSGFNKQDLEHMEANRHYLPLAKCLALAAVLGIDWDDFLKTLI